MTTDTVSVTTGVTAMTAISQRPVGILLPSEQKRNSRKRKKTAHIFRKSVGAFLNAFSSKNGVKYSPRDLAKEREEYRRNHPSDEEEDYYGYYGDPQQEATMTQNPLNGHRSPIPTSPISPTTHREVEVFFEDETSVVVTAEMNI